MAGLRRIPIFVVLFLAIALAGLLVSAARAQTLDAVRERGHLICAAADSMPGFSQQSGDGLWSGFDVDFCRAVAAAVLGSPDLVVFEPLSGEARFAHLQTGAVDLIARSAAWTLPRDTLYGAHYVGTSFYDGEAFMVRQASGVVSAYEFDDVSICLADDQDRLTAVEDFFFENQANYTEIRYEDAEDLSVAYAAGLCDAIAAPASALYTFRRQFADPSAHRILPERITKRPFGPVVRQGDDQWLDIVKWTLFALINAEELGITSKNLDSMMTVKTPSIRRILGLEGDFGSDLGLSPDWMRAVIGAVGNYGEMYARNFGAQTGVAMPRGLNSLWTKGGLLFAPPIR